MHQADAAGPHQPAQPQGGCRQAHAAHAQRDALDADLRQAPTQLAVWQAGDDGQEARVEVAYQQEHLVFATAPAVFGVDGEDRDIMSTAALAGCVAAPGRRRPAAGGPGRR